MEAQHPRGGDLRCHWPMLGLDRENISHQGMVCAMSATVACDHRQPAFRNMALITPDTLRAAASFGCDVTINPSNTHSSITPQHYTKALITHSEAGTGKGRDDVLSACRQDGSSPVLMVYSLKVPSHP